MSIDIPPGPFSVVYADPPWSYKAFSTKGEGRSATRYYSTMTVKDIAALPVREACARDCHLFLWTTGPNLRQAFDVMEGWGFNYSSIAFTWIKLTRSAPTLFLDQHSFHVGMGYTTRKNTEVCLLGRRGSPKRKSRAVRELLIAPVREHSRKPDETIERIEAYADGPYLELFARTQRPGWTAWGNETEKFSPA